MNKNKTAEESDNGELLTQKNLNDRISSIEYALDTLGGKLTGRNRFNFGDVMTPLSQNPIITCEIQFGLSENIFTLHIYGEHFSKPNNFINPPQIRTANVTIYLGDEHVILTGFPRTVQIDENGKFHVRTQIRGSQHIMIFARNNHTDEYAPTLRRRVFSDGNGYGIGEG